MGASTAAPTSITSLVAFAVALGAEDVGILGEAEAALVADADAPPPTAAVRRLRSLIESGHDPLGDAYCAIRSAQARRGLGQTYTPAPIVEAMVEWAGDHGNPGRIVDPGAGSGRYLLAAAKKFPTARLHGAEIDPLATLMLRANLAASGLAGRASVQLGDYRALRLEKISVPTLFIGNPPYVRHHQIAPEWKQWLLTTAAQRGLAASGLSGLHVHFFLATAEHGRPGDYGTFITSAEWLDVNYGKLVRHLLLGELGGESLHVLDPAAAPFADAATTGAITCFRIGQTTSTMRVRRVETVSGLGRLAEGRPVARERLTESQRWSGLTRVSPTLPSGYVELGELCRVHRGAVTGANDVWVVSGLQPELPARVLFPSITKARELFGAGPRLESVAGLRSVVDLPDDLDELDEDERLLVDRFLHAATAKQVDRGYIASHRRTWWRVGLREPAPILATYMARRPPAFVRNDIRARHINIAHGLYPREHLAPAVLDALATHLRSAVTLAQGRTYAGGLVKFEPKEMERLPVPNLEMLSDAARA